MKEVYSAHSLYVFFLWGANGILSPAKIAVHQNKETMTQGLPWVSSIPQEGNGSGMLTGRVTENTTAMTASEWWEICVYHYYYELG